MGFTVKRVLRRVLRRGSEKGVSRRCLERPLGEYAPLGVCPIPGNRDPKLYVSLPVNDFQKQSAYVGGHAGGWRSVVVAAIPVPPGTSHLLCMHCCCASRSPL